jgi:DNA-binding NtrC family response regulator
MPTYFPSFRVLVVEDDPLLGWALRETLVGSGHAVVEARDGAKGLRAAGTALQPFDVIVLDDRLAEREAAWPLLVSFARLSPTSGGVLLADVDRATRREDRIGTWHVLNKPFDMEALDQVVREAAADSRHDRQPSVQPRGNRRHYCGEGGPEGWTD